MQPWAERRGSIPVLTSRFMIPWTQRVIRTSILISEIRSTGISLFSTHPSTFNSARLHGRGRTAI